MHVSCRLGIHHKLNHPLIVKMLDVFISDDNYLNIVLEYVEHGTLINLINTRAPAPSEGVVRWVYHCCSYSGSSSAHPSTASSSCCLASWDPISSPR